MLLFFVGEPSQALPRQMRGSTRWLRAPSQALPRQLSQGESQAVTFVAKVLGIMRKFPVVLLPLPLRKDFPRSGEDVTVGDERGSVDLRSKDGEGARR